MSDLDEWTECLNPEGKDADEADADEGDDEDRLDFRLDWRFNLTSYYRLDQIFEQR